MSRRMSKKPKLIDDVLGLSSSSEAFSQSDNDDASSSTFGELDVDQKKKVTPRAKKAAGSSTSGAGIKKKTTQVTTPAVKKVVTATPSTATSAGQGVVTPSENDTFSVVLPSSWMATGNPPPGDCNLLVQIDPEDAKRLDYEGVSGAIGRFECGVNGIVLDLKGRQYQGSILPGPTAMMVNLSKGQQLRVEGMTDEFASMVQTSDVMAKLDAVVTGAKMDDGYRYVEENVNRVDRTNKQQAQSVEVAGSIQKGGKKQSIGPPKSATKKRK